VLGGFTLLILGIVLGIHYALDRALYMNQLKEAYADKVSKEWNMPSISHEPSSLPMKQLKTKKTNELEECTMYLTEKRGLSEIDARDYCEMLGNRWRELVESSEET